MRATAIMCFWLGFLFGASTSIGAPQTYPVEAAALPRLKPFVGFAWSSAGRCPHIYPCVWISRGTPAFIAARTLAAYPAGCRALLADHSFTDGLLTQEDDRCKDASGTLLEEQGIWPDAGIERVARRFDQFLDGFVFAGGRCDLLVLDFEDNWSNWVMTPGRLAAIQRDPRFAGVARQLGFSDVSAGLDDPSRYIRWNSVVGAMESDALTRAVGSPLLNHLPGSGLSEFGSVVVSDSNIVLDQNGVALLAPGRPVGTYQSPGLYGEVGRIRTVVPANWKDPLSAAIHELNMARAMVRSSGVPLLPWVSCRSRPGDDAKHPSVPWANTNYWQEFVYQMMLSGAVNNVLFFNPRPATVGLFSQDTQDWQAMEDVLADLERQARGHPLVKPLLTGEIKYNSPCVASAARTDDGHIVARVTFAAGATAADFELEGKPIHVLRQEGRLGVWVAVR